MIWGKLTLSRFPFALALAIAALTLLYTGSTNLVQATNFNPTVNVTMSDQTAGGHPDITTDTTIPGNAASSPFFEQAFTFLPDTLAIATDAQVRDGTRAADFDFSLRIGAFNSQCLGFFGSPPDIPFQHATTSRAQVAPFLDGNNDGGNDPNGNPYPNPGDGVKNAVEAYPKYLVQSVPGGEIVRFWGRTILLNVLPVDVHYLIYPAGALGLPAALGKPVLVTFNTGDVGAAPSPSFVTDTCSPYQAQVKSFGLPHDNPDTGVDESNPASQPLGFPGGLQTNPAPSQVLFSTTLLSIRDADNDAVDNSDDSCMYNPNVGTPYQGAPFGDFGDLFESPARDGIDASCDNAAVFTDGNATAWAANGANSTCRAGAADNGFVAQVGGSDCDRDGYPNRGDNCPQVANGLLPDGLIDEDPLDQIDNDGDGQIDEDPVDGVDNPQVVPTSQLDSELLLAGATYSVDGGPKNDATGDACDVNPNVPDGHFHQPLLISAKCITGGGNNDSDGDGYCDATEAGLGSNPALPGSTPENLAFPTVCSDGVDNDGDTNTDLADSGCQKTQHEIAIKKIVGDPTTCSASQPNPKGNYLLHVKNNGPSSSETVEVGILIDAQPVAANPTGTIFPPVPSHRSAATGVTILNSGATITSSGPINIDGDIDLEWLTKAVVTGIGSGTTVVIIKVDYPGCLLNGNANATDYLVSTDICHFSNSDVAPLGLFGAADCDGPSPNPDDGGQDANNSNDGPVNVAVDDQS